LAKGGPLSAILAGINGVAEGVDTAKPLLALAREHNVDLPITTQVEAILCGEQSPRAAIREIMERPQKKEYARKITSPPRKPENPPSPQVADKKPVSKMVAAPSFPSGTSGPVAHPHRLYLCT